MLLLHGSIGIQLALVLHRRFIKFSRTHSLMYFLDDFSLIQHEWDIGKGNNLRDKGNWGERRQWGLRSKDKIKVKKGKRIKIVKCIKLNKIRKFNSIQVKFLRYFPDFHLLYSFFKGLSFEITLSWLYLLFIDWIFFYRYIKTLFLLFFPTYSFHNTLTGLWILFFKPWPLYLLL